MAQLRPRALEATPSKFPPSSACIKLEVPSGKPGLHSPIMPFQPHIYPLRQLAELTRVDPIFRSRGGAGGGGGVGADDARLEILDARPRQRHGGWSTMPGNPQTLNPYKFKPKPPNPEEAKGSAKPSWRRRTCVSWISGAGSCIFCS